MHIINANVIFLHQLCMYRCKKIIHMSLDIRNITLDIKMTHFNYMNEF